MLALILAGTGLSATAIAAPANSASAASTWDQVKSEFHALTYVDVVKASKPRIRALDPINARIALRKELGKEPTEAQVEARVYEKYMAQLNLADSFSRLKAGLDTQMPRLIGIAQPRGIDATFLRNNKSTILLGLTYLNHYYGFNLAGKSALERMLDGPHAASIINVANSIGTAGYEWLRGYQSAAAYKRFLAAMTGAASISAFVEGQLTQHAPGLSPNDWLKQTSKAVIVDKASTPLWAKYVGDPNLDDHLLVLLALSGPSVYVGNITETLSYGLTSTYGGPSAQFDATLERALTEQSAFWAFWERMSTTKNDYRNTAHVVSYDTLKRAPSTGNTASKRWSPEYGEATDPGVREFIVPLNKYKPFTFASGVAEGTDIRYWLSEALTREGVNTYTHELTHIYDQIVWFNGLKRRADVGHETYARGLYETEDNTPGTSQYAPFFNLNTAYELGANRLQNASPRRFSGPADVKDYMRGAMDVLYSLDAMEALAALKLDAAGKAAAFNKIVQVADPGHTTTVDSFQRLPQAEAAAITTLDQVVDAGLVSGRMMPKGLEVFTTVPHNEYVVAPLFEPIYAGQQTDAGAVGGISFRRYAHELLAEYGWQDGLIGYVSNKYPNDAAALAAIMPEHGGNMATFKKAMFQRRVDKFADMKPAAGFNTAAEMQAAMDAAVRADVARIQAGNSPDLNKGLAGGGTEVHALKERIFRAYLLSTDDFRTSIYAQRAGSFTASADLTLLDEASGNPTPLGERAFQVKVVPSPANDAAGYAGVPTQPVAFANGRAELGTWSFTKAGTYTFTYTQVRGTNPKVRYDETAFTQTITVAPDPANADLFTVTSVLKTGERVVDSVRFTNLLKRPVIIEERSTRTEKIPIEDEIVEDPTVLSTEPDVVIRPGREGERTIVTLQRFRDGEPLGEPEVISTTITIQMETRQIRRGTKPPVTVTPTPTPTPRNQAPAVTVSPDRLEVFQGAPFEAAVTAVDADGSVAAGPRLAADAPGWARVVGTRISGVVPLQQGVGAVTVSVEAVDNDGATGTAALTVVVKKNHAPLIEVADAAVAAGASIQLPVRVSDPDGHSAQVRLTGATHGLSLDAQNRIVGTAPAGGKVISLTLLAIDEFGMSATKTVTITVKAAAPSSSPMPTVQPSATAKPSSTPAPKPSATAAPGASATPTHLPQPGPKVVQRFAGTNRVDTALKAWVGGDFTGRSVVMANALSFADAVAAGPLAGALEAPVVLTNGKTLEPAILTAMKEKGIDHVVLAGGTAVISAQIEASLRANGISVQRLGGTNRYATAVSLATETAKLVQVEKVMVADGTNFADGLTSGAVAKPAKAVVIYSQSRILPVQSRTYLNANVGKKLFGIGGSAVAALDSAGWTAGSKSTAVVGADRYATAVAIANTFAPTATEFVFATGKDFADALSGAALASRRGGVLMLTTTSGLPTSVNSYVRARSPQRIAIMGGTNSVSMTVERTLRAMIR
ncbi:ZmpA/ZmpB/ZmpC family metallo-endopeptidase [Buchananella felis]|uniref:ZmpA/ZmpB/ZmpC family metallo-endopeptidase n=1 Tax=Buchananella felis TaxID=3231492 RepID=UPI0035272E8C